MGARKTDTERARRATGGSCWVELVVSRRFAACERFAAGPVTAAHHKARSRLLHGEKVYQILVVKLKVAHRDSAVSSLTKRRGKGEQLRQAPGDDARMLPRTLRACARARAREHVRRAGRRSKSRISEP